MTQRKILSNTLRNKELQKEKISSNIYFFLLWTVFETVFFCVFKKVFINYLTQNYKQQCPFH